MPKNARFRDRDKFGINLDRLRAYRKLNNKFQQDMADLLEISLTAYSAKEQGRVDFEATEIGIMADCFNISPAELYSYSPILA